MHALSLFMRKKPTILAMSAVASLCNRRPTSALQCLSGVRLCELLFHQDRSLGSVKNVTNGAVSKALIETLCHY